MKFIVVSFLLGVLCIISLITCIGVSVMQQFGA